MKLKQLEDENANLRNKLLEVNDEKFGLQASIAAIEVEAKHMAKIEVDKLQSELNFKVIMLIYFLLCTLMVIIYNGIES